MSGDRCGFEKEDGQPCRAPMGLCSSCGHCISHCDYGPECDYDADEVQESRAAGGHATARSGSLRTEELPPLDSAAAAEVWCDVVGRAAATDRIGANAANAALRAVREWREARETGARSDRLQRLEEAVKRSREAGGLDPLLEVVEGGET